jgi:ankyrin repeat protein
LSREREGRKKKNHGFSTKLITMPSISNLPTELVVFVIENLDHLKDIAALARSSRQLQQAAEPILYQRAISGGDVWPLAWAAHGGIAGTLRKALVAGADPNYRFIDTQPVDLWKRSLAAARAPAVADDDEPTTWDVAETDYDEPDSHMDWSPTSISREEEILPFSEPPPPPSMFLGMNMYDESDTLSDASTASSDAGENEHLSSDASGADSSTLGYSDGMRINSADSVVRNFSPLHLAARGGHDEAVRVLLAHGAIVNTMSENFCDCKYASGLLNAMEGPEFETHAPAWSPLHVAICHSRLDTVKLLMAHGADYMMEAPARDASSIRRNYGSTALHYAAATGNVELLKYLMQQGFQDDIEVTDSRSLTPFYYAYANERWDSTIPALIEMGANIDVEIKFFQPYCAITPLGESCRLGRFDVAQKLVSVGANAAVGFLAWGSGHRKGLSPLHLCCMASARPTAVEPLMDSHPFEDEDEGNQRMKTMDVFISKGTSIHQTDCSGDTPLITAVQNRVAPAVKALVRAGADVHVRNAVGRNALMQAVLGPPNPFPGVVHNDCDGALVEIFTELFRNGARIEDVDPSGNTVLHLIFKGRPEKEFQQQVLRLLLNQPSANELVLAKNNDGQSPFHMAFQTRNIEACEILVRRGYVRGMIDRDELLDMFRHALHEPTARGRALNFVLDLDVNRELCSDPVLFAELLSDGGYAALHAARTICSRGLPKMSHEAGTHLLRRAIHVREWTIAYHLIETGADVNGMGEQGDSPLTAFIQRYTTLDHEPLQNFLKLLLDRGADIHNGIPGQNQSRPLNRAIAMGSEKLVSVLLKKQPLRDDPRAAGGFYLHHALRITPVEKRFPNEKMISALIESGANLAELDDNGDSPLSKLLRDLCSERYFAWHYHRYVRALLSPAVDINRKNMEGRSIVDYLEQLMRPNTGDLEHVQPLSRRLQLIDSLDGSGTKQIKFLTPPKPKVKSTDIWRT